MIRFYPQGTVITIRSHYKVQVDESNNSCTYNVYFDNPSEFQANLNIVVRSGCLFSLSFMHHPKNNTGNAVLYTFDKVESDKLFINVADITSGKSYSICSSLFGSDILQRLGASVLQAGLYRLIAAQHSTEDECVKISERLLQAMEKALRPISITNQLDNLDFLEKIYNEIGLEEIIFSNIINTANLPLSSMSIK